MQQTRQLFCDAAQFLEKHLERNVTSQELAQQFSVSKSTLFRSFRTCTGMGVRRYVIQMRIEKATQMLSEGSSVSQTADRLGFGTPGYFSARYKKETGRNPSEVIRML